MRKHEAAEEAAKEAAEEAAKEADKEADDKAANKVADEAARQTDRPFKIFQDVLKRDNSRKYKDFLRNVQIFIKCSTLFKMFYIFQKNFKTF